jgi:hypothetical protein
MGFVQDLRTVFGIGSEVSNSSALAQARDEIDARIAKCGEKIQALERELPSAVIRSIDSGATERRKLAQLQREQTGLEATRVVIERDLAEALAAERAAEMAARWATAKRHGDKMLATARRLNDAIDGAADLMMALLNQNDAFVQSLPRLAGDYSGSLVETNLPSQVGQRVRVRSGDRIHLGRVLEHLSLNQLQPDLVAFIKEQLFVALREEASGKPARSSAPTPLSAAESESAAIS